MSNFLLSKWRLSAFSNEWKHWRATQKSPRSIFWYSCPMHDKLRDAGMRRVHLLRAKVLPRPDFETPDGFMKNLIWYQPGARPQAAGNALESTAWGSDGFPARQREFLDG